MSETIYAKSEKGSNGCLWPEDDLDMGVTILLQAIISHAVRGFVLH